MPHDELETWVLASTDSALKYTSCGLVESLVDNTTATVFLPRRQANRESFLSSSQEWLQLTTEVPERQRYGRWGKQYRLVGAFPVGSRKLVSGDTSGASRRR